MLGQSRTQKKEESLQEVAAYAASTSDSLQGAITPGEGSRLGGLQEASTSQQPRGAHNPQQGDTVLQMATSVFEQPREGVSKRTRDRRTEMQGGDQRPRKEQGGSSQVEAGQIDS